MLSGDDEDGKFEPNRKLKPQPGTSRQNVSPDLALMMNWMKKEFDGVKADLTEKVNNRVESLEEKLRNIMLSVVKEEADKAQQEFKDRIDGLASKLESKIKQSV